MPTALDVGSITFRLEVCRGVSLRARDMEDEFVTSFLIVDEVCITARTFCFENDEAFPYLQGFSCFDNWRPENGVKIHSDQGHTRDFWTVTSSFGVVKKTLHFRDSYA